MNALLVLKNLLPGKTGRKRGGRRAGFGRSATGKLQPFHNVGMTVRRMKTYSGAQGYVYEYYFVGKRAALPQDPEAPATEFIFDVTSDRKTTFSVSVFLEREALQAWTEGHGRAPVEAEEYAAAKMRLFQAFDEVEDMMATGRSLTVDRAAFEATLATLGVD